MPWPVEEVQIVGAGMGQHWRQLNEILAEIFAALNALEARIEALKNPPPP